MYQLKIPDMTCGHCTKAIDGAVKELDQSATVQVDLRTKTVQIQSIAKLPEILAAVQRAGFKTQSL